MGFVPASVGFVPAFLQRAGGIGVYYCYPYPKKTRRTKALASVAWARYVRRKRRKGCLPAVRGELA